MGSFDLELDETDPANLAAPRRVASVMELHGLGSDTWEGIDPDAYVERLRSEWDDRG